ncbi:hypothetical protein HFP51_04445 [Parasphingopyxis sp. CP4]|uniref:hypothetical protein n=1 Tax=Parasphingopyxis sp. CP4 TaxID=2724527 RepID=UPI0015A2D558|nr:hypothetical protein [Parasphingopyxis sp. CP4]QLC21494.1 hypothetical protein HFP51_04445 [Parasphingopyxis sp. CP4]
MKKMIATLALVAAAGLVGSAASAQVGIYPGGLPGDHISHGGPDGYTGHWSYGGPNAGPTNLPAAVSDAQRAAIWGAFGTRFYGTRGFGRDSGLRDEVIRLEDSRDGDAILRRVE